MNIRKGPPTELSPQEKARTLFCRVASRTTFGGDKWDLVGFSKFHGKITSSALALAGKNSAAWQEEIRRRPGRSMTTY